MIKKSIIYIINAIFIFVFVCAGGIFAGHLTGYKPYVVLSGSMEPNIHEGSLAVVNTHYNYDDVKVEDIIAYETPTSIAVTHRVINIEDGVLETKGDNNDVSDGFTTNKDNFLGLTLFSIPFVGYVLSFISTTRGLILTAIALISLLIIEEMVKITMKKENTNETTE